MSSLSSDESQQITLHEQGCASAHASRGTDVIVAYFAAATATTTDFAAHLFVNESLSTIVLLFIQSTSEHRSTLLQYSEAEFH